MTQSNKQPYISKAFTEGKIDRKLRMLEGVARILSDNYKVTVVFSPDGECKTTETNMTLPYDKGVDEALILGLCGHETGHLKYTEFSIARAISRHKKVRNRYLLYVIFNVLEDVRIEIEMEKVYPGFQEMFKRLVPYIKGKKQPMLDREEKIKQMKLKGCGDEEIAEVIAKDCEQELKELVKSLQQAGFSEEYIEFEVDQLKRAQSSLLAEVQKILDVVYMVLRNYEYDWYPAEVVDFVQTKVLETAKEVYNAKNSQEVLDVALKVYDILYFEPPSDPSKKKNNKGQEEGDKSKTGKSKSSTLKAGESKAKYKGNKNKTKGDKKEGEGGPSGKVGKCEQTGGENEDGSGGQDDENEDEDTIRIGLTRVLKVGSKVTHLNDPSKKGVVTAINRDTQEVLVEWE